MNGEAPRRAEHHRGWWPGWIWSVPIAAVGLVGWLALRSWMQAGPEVTVVFPVIADLQPGNTNVTFEGYTVGQVEAVSLAPDLKHMKATIRMHDDMRGHLGKGTAFWIIGRSMSLAHLTNIKSLISGVSVGVRPARGKVQPQYVALAHDPVLGFDARGTEVTLHADRLGSIGTDTPIFYLGEQAGTVVRQTMTGAHSVAITAFIDAPYDKLLHDGSRFWRAGPIHLSMGANGPSVQFQSLPALFEGAIAFETPDDAAAGAIATPGHDFTLYANEDAARYAPDGQGVPYRVVFDGASGVPQANAPVTLLGQRVGSVSHGALQYDAASGRLQVVATIVLEPHDIGLAGDAAWTAPRAQMDAMLRHLVAQGLHAELSASPPVIGGQQVALRIIPGETGTLGAGTPPEIPTTAGGGIAGIMTQASNVMDKMEALPLTRIGDNLRDISDHLNKLTSSPALAATLTHVDRSTASLQRITEEMQHDVPPTLAELRRTVAAAQASLTQAQDLLSARGAVASAPDSAALPQTLYEITRTARSLRELANYLDQHPSAVLTGRAGP